MLLAAAASVKLKGFPGFIAMPDAIVTFRPMFQQNGTCTTQRQVCQAEHLIERMLFHTWRTASEIPGRAKVPPKL